MDEEERGEGGVRRPRGPAADDGAVGEGDGGVPEAGGGEGAVVAAVPLGCEANAGRHLGGFDWEGR